MTVRSESSSVSKVVSERNALGEREERGQNVRVRKTKRFGQELSLFHVSV